MRLTCRDKRLVGALQNPLCANVNPRSRRHLPVHDEPELLETTKFVPVGKTSHEVRICNQNPRRIGMCTYATNRFARLNKKRLVVFELLQFTHDDIERFPRPRRFTRAAVHDEVFRTFSNLWIEIVLKHSKRCFLKPSFARKSGSPSGTNNTRTRYTSRHDGLRNVASVAGRQGITRYERIVS